MYTFNKLLFENNKVTVFIVFHNLKFNWLRWTAL